MIGNRLGMQAKPSLRGAMPGSNPGAINTMFAFLAWIATGLKPLAMTARAANRVLAPRERFRRSVIPANAGIQGSKKRRICMRLTWVPACAGTTLRSAGFRVSVFAFVSLAICCAPCGAELSTGQLREVELNPRPGAALPLGAAFSAGSARVSLKDALDGRPAVLVLADFKCRFTCGTALAIAADGLTQTGLEAGRDYNLLVIGINPGAGIADAEAMKAAYLAPYPRLQAAAKFLSGDAAAIASVTDALGYKAVYDAQRDEFAHPLGAAIVTPEGRVSNVIEGLNLSAALLRPAILDARQSRLAAFVEGVRLLCYGRNPLEGAYTSTVQAALQGGALLTVLGIGAALLFLGRRKGART